MEEKPLAACGYGPLVFDASKDVIRAVLEPVATLVLEGRVLPIGDARVAFGVKFPVPTRCDVQQW